MRLDIVHRTVYRYANPVSYLPHRILTLPRVSADLSLLRASLNCSPPAEIAWAQDVFGNAVATVIFHEPSRELVIDSTATVDQSAPKWPVYRIEPVAHAYPFAYSPDECIDLGALCIPEPEGPDRGVATWTDGFVRGPPTDTLSLLKDINAGILRSVTYRRRDEEGTQTAAETLARSEGSCRDIAALFIEAVRHLGFGARAVSGYVFDPETSEPSSTHAWAEVYLPGAGWIPFDPTHQRVGGANLVAAAVGRNNRQIMPVVGGYIGSAEDFLGMEVEVSVSAVA